MLSSQKVSLLQSNFYNQHLIEFIGLFTDKNYMIKFCFLKKTRLLNCKIAKLKHDLNFDFTGTSSDIKRKLVSRNISPNSGVSVNLFVLSVFIFVMETSV